MGQPITVSEIPTRRPGLVRFEIDRSLTGMAHEHFRAGGEIAGHRPPDELARRLLARAGVISVHIFSNEITVELEPQAASGGLREIIESLYIHYTEGVSPSIP